MTLLTEAERNAIEDACEMMIGKPAFDAIEAAVIKKLATVSVEPVATVQMHPDGRRRVLFKDSVADCDAQWRTTQQLYTATQLAAARAQSDTLLRQALDALESVLKANRVGIRPPTTVMQAERQLDQIRAAGTAAESSIAAIKQHLG